MDILLVEDDRLLASLYQKKLTFEGFKVEVVRDGAKALERAPRLLPAVIILDFMLPKVHGFQVLKKLKAHPLTKSIPIIGLTALPKVLLPKINCQAVLFKANTTPEEVVNAVRRFTSKISKTKKNVAV